MLEKIEHITMLKDFYGPLLTEKQQAVLYLYYENDWSMTEIAGHMGITRQAVFDLLKRSEKALEEYEDRLHLVARFYQVRRKMEEVYTLLNRPDPDRDTVSRAAELLREVSDSL
ncbi:YlxM family DNA-binding protein [Syntrophomonas erecta]